MAPPKILKKAMSNLGIDSSRQRSRTVRHPSPKHPYPIDHELQILNVQAVHEKKTMGRQNN